MVTAAPVACPVCLLHKVRKTRRPAWSAASHLLGRSDEPFFKPEADFERTGQSKAGATFLEGLVLFNGKWLLYYGCADSFVAVAEAKQ